MNGTTSIQIKDGSSRDALFGTSVLSTAPVGNLNGRAVTIEQEEEGCCLWACLRAIFCFSEEDVAPTKQYNKSGVEILPPIEETNLEEPSASEMEMQRRTTASENDEARDPL